MVKKNWIKALWFSAASASAYRQQKGKVRLGKAVRSTTYHPPSSHPTLIARRIAMASSWPTSSSLTLLREDTASSCVIHLGQSVALQTFGDVELGDVELGDHLPDLERRFLLLLLLPFLFGSFLVFGDILIRTRLGFASSYYLGER